MGMMPLEGLVMGTRSGQLKEHDDRRVRLAIEIFCYRARKYVGSYLAAMNGADAIVFTGGRKERVRLHRLADWLQSCS